MKTKNKEKKELINKFKILGYSKKMVEQAIKELNQEEEMRKENLFEISEGNIKVLESIPKMMMDEEYRKRLRLLVIEFNFKKWR